MVRSTRSAGKPRKKQIKSAEKDITDGLQNLAPISYSIGPQTITALQVYQNPGRKPESEGPWTTEGDKIAWVDEGTGLGCIILRQEDGTLSGYVGVGSEHPLFGFAPDAVPLDIATHVHGGLTYGKECEVNRSELRAKGKPRQERYTICHVTRTRWVQDVESVQTTRDEFPHEDLWWLGFDTNHVGDHIPNDPYHTPRKSDVYRDEGYVYGHCVALARRLKAVGDRKATSRAACDAAVLSPPAAEEK